MNINNGIPMLVYTPLGVCTFIAQAYAVDIPQFPVTGYLF